MKRLYRFIFLIFIAGIFLSFNPLLQANSLPIQLKSNQSEIDYKHNIIQATENVQLLYGGFTLDTQRFIFDNNKQVISVPTPFQITGKNEIIRGTNLEYHTNTYTGEANSINATIQNLHITCNKMLFASDKITLRDSSFTTCDETAPDSYIIRSETIYLYPQWGYFIALNNKIDLEFLPFSIPIPTYIYGAKKYGLSGATSLIPDVGSNRVDGFYVEQKIGYFLHPKSTGSVDFGYTEHHGFFEGLSHRFTFKDFQYIHLSTRFYQFTEPTGHLLFDSTLSTIQNNEILPSSLDDLIDSFDDKKTHKSSLYVRLQHREFVNNYRVSYAPMIGLKRSLNPLWKFEHSFDLNGANITEFDRINDRDIHRHHGRFQLNNTIEYPFPFLRYLDPTLSMDFFGNWYTNDATWTRTFGRWSIQHHYSSWLWKASYSQKIGSNDRNTPFLYEQEFAQENNEIGLLTQFNWGRFRIQSDLHYDLKTQQPRTWDLLGSIRLRCLRLNIEWKTQESRLQFGLDLY